jgi:hypothetical protein
MDAPNTPGMRTPSYLGKYTPGMRTPSYLGKYTQLFKTSPKNTIPIF